MDEDEENGGEVGGGGEMIVFVHNMEIVIYLLSAEINTPLQPLRKR